MLSIDTALPTSIDLTEDLKLRFATREDAEAIVELNTRIFDERVTDWARDLLSGRHVTVQPGDFTVVEDLRAQRIVSTMVFIPQTWSYAGIPFAVARAELVSSDPAYRRQGLVRKQFELLHARSLERGELMQVITGVPWFYRQFGYEMGVKLWGSRSINASRLQQISHRGGCGVRPITTEDQAFIRETYEASAARRLLAAQRSPAEWDYEFAGRSVTNTRRREWLILQGEDGERLGYVQYLPCFASPNSPVFRVYQIEVKAGVGYLNIWRCLLDALWTTAIELQSAGILGPGELASLELALEREHPLFHIIPRDWFRDTAQSPWYIRVPDRVALLQRMKPALERQLAASPGAGYTGELKLNFYRDGLCLDFAHGQLAAVERWTPGDLAEGNATFPGGTFVQLLCGWRRVQEITDNYPDSRADHDATIVLNGLFRACHDKAWVLASIALCLVHSIRLLLTRTSTGHVWSTFMNVVDFAKDAVVA